MTKALSGRLLGPGGGLLGGVGLLLVAGCGASQPPSAASPSAPSSTTATTPHLSAADLNALAARYLAIARPANHRLDVDNDGYGDNEKDDLAAAKHDLRAETATERLFDRQLLAIRFPPQLALTAEALVRANHVRIALTAGQARSASLARLRSFDHRHKAADAAVEVQVRIIRQQLHLPPPATS